MIAVLHSTPCDVGQPTKNRRRDWTTACLTHENKANAAARLNGVPERRISTVFNPSCGSTSLGSCQLCNIHNLSNTQNHSSQISLHKQHTALICFTLSCWNICRVVQYSRNLGFRLVPYAWICRPVQNSKIGNQPKYTLSKENHHRQTLCTTGLQSVKTLNRRESIAASVIYDEMPESTDLICELLADDLDESLPCPCDGTIDCGDDTTQAYGSMKRSRGSSPHSTATSLISGGTSVSTKDSKGSRKEESEEDTSTDSPNLESYADSSTLSRPRDNIATNADPLAMPIFREPNQPESKLGGMTNDENHFLSPDRQWLPKATSKDDLFAEKLTDLLDTSTSLEDHVNDFTDLLGREFDNLVGTYLDLCPKATQNDSKVANKDYEGSERTLKCITVLSSL